MYTKKSIKYTTKLKKLTNYQERKTVIKQKMDCLTTAITNTTSSIREGVIYVARQLGYRTPEEIRQIEHDRGMMEYCQQLSEYGRRG